MKRSTAYRAAEATLPKSLHKQFEMLTEDYRGAAVIIHTRLPFVNCKILAALVDACWRRKKPAPKQQNPIGQLQSNL